ncbi:unnamed protein product [Tetraodon nigroviridis]|uniref:(spotted green pufferfish) hypothetical protein n=1 Tax=Tetraodon nigroviridis TaxID=99883 RepID=Q4S6M5_TETNG|nr:unnamed protein product [Tetraodon nigroviridis]
MFCRRPWRRLVPLTRTVFDPATSNGRGPGATHGPRGSWRLLQQGLPPPVWGGPGRRPRLRLQDHQQRQRTLREETRCSELHSKGSRTCSEARGRRGRRGRRGHRRLALGSSG